MARNHLPLDRLYYLKGARRLAEAIVAEHLSAFVSMAYQLVSANTESLGRFNNTIASTIQMFTLALTTLRCSLIAFYFSLSTAKKLSQTHDLLPPSKSTARTSH